MKKYFLKIIQIVLGNCARRVIDKFDPFIIGVTGSVGKSSTKEAIYAVLSREYGRDVWCSQSNLNNEIGLPLAVLGFEKTPSRLSWPIFLVRACVRSYGFRTYPKYLILEYGVDKPGDMDYLLSIARPNLAMITAVSLAHSANFAKEEEYYAEKRKIAAGTKGGGLTIVNVDDANLASCREWPREIKAVGLSRTSADYYAEAIKLSLSGTDFRLSCPGHKISIKSRLLGYQMIYPALFAFAVANFLDISLLGVGKSLEGVKPLPGRMNLFLGLGDSLILDDTYNANPRSVAAALDFVAAVKYSDRKIAIIGNMNELGDRTTGAHKEIGQYARGKVDLAIFVGPNASVMAEGYGDPKTVETFSNRSETIAALPGLVRPHDLILVKASQNGNYFEEIVKLLLKSPRDAAKLVRQSKGWMKIKNQKYKE
ncbi:MAG: UDP-N-acetylmuramoyl-tripeptide--D-alanyl-D-alanine ligase [Patescibacteria group bacterium]